MTWIRRNLKIVVPAVTVIAAGVAYLTFGVFGVHTLFVDDRVDQAGPEFDSGAGTEVAVAEPVTPESTGDTPAATDETPDATVPAPSVPPTAVTPQIVTLADGMFIPRGRYSGEGRALVLNDGSEQRFLRFENFATDNGPDLNVYLVAGTSADGDSGTFDDDFVDLGDLLGNIGDQNYEIPPDVDLSVYNTVVVWCVRFGTPFTAADLMPIA
jgi:hypothetical protein